MLPYTFRVQINGYYCGPAATQIALTARKVDMSQDDLAGRLGTTAYGTNSAADTTRVLNALLPSASYQTTFIDGGAPTAAEVDHLRGEVVNAVASGYAVVANIVGGASDTSGAYHSYPAGHYIAVVGYRDNGDTVKIADPAITAGQYWMATTELANWAASRGYSS